MNPLVRTVAALLFGSGFCALVYQVAWLRELRLVFGGSTAASSAVLAIFMGGLGLGSLKLGPRADRHPNPLAFYAGLELSIAITAAVSPLLVMLVRWLYISLGGTTTMGLTGATIVRLLLSVLILGVPTFLMGGTLPAAAKAVETQDDRSRRNVAILYGLNTLGAVTGAFVATFLLLELFGTRRTLLAACGVNALVGLTARMLSRTLSEEGRETMPRPVVQSGVAEEGVVSVAAGAADTRLRSRFVLVSAGVVGFAFLLMELVWFRMLTPLLGGTTFTFGLILATALLGIGLGGAIYALFGETRRWTVRGFAVTCLLEAACLAIPYALGDRLAVLAVLVKPMDALGFYGSILSWSAMALIVVFPAALVSGFQFPLLLALLGEGEKEVGRHVGQAYAWNTAGAILGSLAGGFGALPLLTAPGTWKAAIVLLVVLGVWAMVLSVRLEPARRRLSLPGLLALATCVLLFASGPSAAWRHSPVGAGRIHWRAPTPNTVQQWLNNTRQEIHWDADGVESTVAIGYGDSGGYYFNVNGKSDGSARGDASTQVMLGMVGAILHPNPRRAFVVGLGTGSTAGWLGEVPTMERVDVVELEPAVLEMARRCTPVNKDVLNHPKVNLIIGDGREILLTSRDQYDLIVSEPSNPYRAGVSSLYTQEYYRAAAEHLGPEGLFVQWVQGYEVDATTMRTVLATLASVFDFVEVWQTNPDDLLLLGSMRSIRYDVESLRKRIQQEPFRSALLLTWRAWDLEGFLARFVCGPMLARMMVAQEFVPVNTDDCNVVEFGFARTLGRVDLFSVEEVRARAVRDNWHRPPIPDGLVDWDQVEDERLCLATEFNTPAAASPSFSDHQKKRAEAHRAYVSGNLGAAMAAWQSQSKQPKSPMEVILLADGLAAVGDEKCLTYLDRIAALPVSDVEAVRARYHFVKGEFEKAVESLERVFQACRESPWGWSTLIRGALDLARRISSQNDELAKRLFAALEKPFSVMCFDRDRRLCRIDTGIKLSRDQVVPIFETFEPNVPWNFEFLSSRFQAYSATSHPLRPVAETELTRFRRYIPGGFTLSSAPRSAGLAPIGTAPR